MGERYCRDLRSAVAENYLNSSYSQAKESNASLLAQFLGDDAREIRQSFTRICGSIPTEIANSFFYFCFLALLDTQLFVLFFSIFLPIGLIIRLTGNHLRKLAKTGIRIQTELSQSFLEKVRGWQSIQSFSSRPTELKRFNSTNSTILNIWRRSARAKAMSSPTVEWLGIAAGACVLILALRRVHEGALANTILTAFLVTVVQLSNSLQTTVNQLNGAKKGSAALNRMFEFLDQIGSQQNRQTKESRRKTENMLSLKRTLRANDVAIRRQGSEGEYLFRDLKFEFNFGENILVKGPSGRGKSTLLESICGLKPPDKGHFSIELENGRIIENPRLSDFAEVAYLTQEPFIFAGTVGENVCYPHKWDSKCMTDLTRVRTALEKACLSNLSVDASVLTLSGGERQRLAFARGFFSEPDVWLIDEGTSALDAQTEQQLLHQLKSKSEKSIKIFVAHRPMTQKFVDKVITLDQL
jgi:ABC-type multidrug transport system fused ATPase/permease subunit